MGENLIVEFNGIRFLKSYLSTTTVNLPDAPNLFKVFRSIINKTNLEVYQYHIQQILTNDLKIDEVRLSPQVLAVLVDASIYYITHWPGWQRHKEYQNGTLTLEEWFERFHQYLVFKSKYIIKSAAIQQNKLSTVDNGTQTLVVPNGKKPLAPFTFCLQAPLFVLNNVVFEEQNGNILLRRCKETIWRDPELKELLHWPHISISLNLPDISITRSNVPHIERYMGLFGDLCIPVENDHIIHIQKISVAEDNAHINMKPYTLEFFTFYIRQLVSTLGKIPGVLGDRLGEIELLLHEFLLDIDESNVYDKTMCTCISLRYHIGKFTYLRNRKTIVSRERRLSENQNSISYYENIVPQMDFTLHYFKTAQDLSVLDEITFVSLNELLKQIKQNIKCSEIENIRNIVNTTCLTYTCTLCNTRECGPNAKSNIIVHLRDVHRAEQPLLCYKCSKEFDIYTLTKNRWLHSCSKK